MQKCLVYLPFRVFNPTLRARRSIVAQLLQNRWKIVKKCENQVRKTREFCAQFVHVFLIWRVIWLLKITLICTWAKSAISSYLRAKWRFGPLEFTFLRLFLGCRLFLALTFGEGTIGEGHTQYHLKRLYDRVFTLTFDILMIERQWNFDKKSNSDRKSIGVLMKTDRDFDHTSIGSS
jgi:hypothetical protein